MRFKVSPPTNENSWKKAVDELFSPIWNAQTWNQIKHRYNIKVLNQIHNIEPLLTFLWVTGFYNSRTNQSHSFNHAAETFKEGTHQRERNFEQFSDGN